MVMQSHARKVAHAGLKANLPAPKVLKLITHNNSIH